MILPAHFYTGVDKNAKTKVSQSTVVFFFIFKINTGWFRECIYFLMNKTPIKESLL